MRRLLTIAALAVVSWGTANAADTMYVTTSSGVTPLALADVSDFRFPETGGLVVNHLAGASTVFGASEFQSITFDPTNSSVADINAGQYGIVFDGAVLISTSEITLYNIDGTQVAGLKGTQVSVADLPAGVYIATTQESTLKFVKR